ncbi:hypothetical protein D3C72_2391700 [compost metagenome]
MHPRHPLPTIAQAPAQAELEWRQQTLEHAAVTGQHQTGAHQHHAHAQGFGALRGFLPGAAQLRGEILADRR